MPKWKFLTQGPSNAIGAGELAMAGKHADLIEISVGVASDAEEMIIELIHVEIS